MIVADTWDPSVSRASAAEAMLLIKFLQQHLSLIAKSIRGNKKQ